MKRYLFLIGLFLLAIALFGCGVKDQDKPDATISGVQIEVVKDEVEIQTADLEEVQLNKSVEYKEFTRQEYQRALAEGNTVFLNFYANWCPICKREKPDIVGALNKVTREDLVAFQVNYNDSETDEDEKRLAEKFQVPYQHTKLIINSNEEILFKTLEVLSEGELQSKLMETK